jgi:hypothetical protein
VYSCSEKKIRAGFDMSDRTIPLSDRGRTEKEFVASGVPARSKQKKKKAEEIRHSRTEEKERTRG